MSKHTSGPWAVVQGYYPSIKEIDGPSFPVKAAMWATDLIEDDYQKRDADLHLIAAAPELLDAAEMAFCLLDNFVEDPRVDVEIKATMAELQKAINKAKGE